MTWTHRILSKVDKTRRLFMRRNFIQDRVLCSWLLTNFEINLAPFLINFVRQAVPVPLVFLNYYRPGLLFADFGDAKTLVRWTRNHIGLLLSLRCWVTGQFPALDSLLDSFYSRGGVVSHLQGFPTFRVLASTRGRVPKYICPHREEVSKRQY